MPDYVDKFATGFISEIHKGNIDSCLTVVLPEINNDSGKLFLTNTYEHIRSFRMDSFKIINARKTSMLGNDGFTNYGIDYEYVNDSNSIYFTFGINEKNGKLTITAFNAGMADDSLADSNAISLKDKGFLHYLFLFFAILTPIFIIVTLIFAIRTNLTKRWLWIIGILIGFAKFSLNWTTGQVGFSLIHFSLFGAGFSKSGDYEPWILSFSIPVMAIIFWFRKYGHHTEEQERLNEKINDLANQNSKG